MYACGLRISEAATLEVGAIDGANRLLRIVGKGDKQRLVPLPAPLLNELRGLWRAHRHPRWLFPSRDGASSVNQHVLGRTFRTAARAAGITQPVTAHALRHSYATRLLEHGVDTRHIIANWGWVFLGNLIGSVVYGVLLAIALTNMGTLAPAGVAARIVAAAEAKKRPSRRTRPPENARSRRATRRRRRSPRRCMRG